MKRQPGRELVAGCLVLGLGLAARAAPPAEVKPPTFRPVGSHQAAVGSVAFSPDGKTLASGGGDKVVRLWDPATGKELRTHKASQGFTCCVRFSPDGKLLAEGGYGVGGGTFPMLLWDTATGRPTKSFGGHPGGVRRLAFTPDGQKVVSGGFDGTVRVWDLASGKELCRLGGLASNITLAVSPDGKLVGLGDGHGARLWDLSAGLEVRALGAPRDMLTRGVAFSPDGRLFASAEVGAVPLYEVATGQEVARLEADNNPFMEAVFSPDGRVLYAANFAGTTRAWDVSTGKGLGKWQEHRDAVGGIALSPDAQTLVSVGHDHRLLAWDVAGFGKAAGAKAVKLSPRDLEARWEELGGADAGRAYRAVWALAADPARGLPFLRRRLPLTARRDPPPDARLLARLVADLDADSFEVREKASAQLEKAGRQAEGVLRRALEGTPSLEVKRRAERLLRGLGRPRLPPGDLRALRGVQALEYMGTVDARRALVDLAAGPPGLRLTEEAKAVARRPARPGAR